MDSSIEFFRVLSLSVVKLKNDFMSSKIEFTVER